MISAQFEKELSYAEIEVSWKDSRATPFNVTYQRIKASYFCKSNQEHLIQVSTDFQQ